MVELLLCLRFLLLFVACFMSSCVDVDASSLVILSLSLSLSGHYRIVIPPSSEFPALLHAKSTIPSFAGLASARSPAPTPAPSPSPVAMHTTSHTTSMKVEHDGAAEPLRSKRPPRVRGSRRKKARTKPRSKPAEDLSWLLSGEQPLNEETVLSASPFRKLVRAYDRLAAHVSLLQTQADDDKPMQDAAPTTAAESGATAAEVVASAATAAHASSSPASLPAQPVGSAGTALTGLSTQIEKLSTTPYLVCLPLSFLTRLLLLLDSVVGIGQSDPRLVCAQLSVEGYVSMRVSAVAGAVCVLLLAHLDQLHFPSSSMCALPRPRVCSPWWLLE
jgi:hypothetical protein